MNNPNIYPVDHVTSMLMDGKCINLINLWRRHDISSGDDMILVLKKMVPNEYILSRQTNSYNRQAFSGMPHDANVPGLGKVNLETRRQEVHVPHHHPHTKEEESTKLIRILEQGVWQLVPYIYDMKHAPENPTEYDFRENGYWHICKALQMFPADPRFEYDNYNDATKYRTTGELMEVSFQPLFIEGLPDGSSRGIIEGKHDYPKDKQQLGIAPGKNLTGVGPATGAWKAYLKQKKRRRDADGDEWHIGDEHDGPRARRHARRSMFGNVAIMGTGMVDGNGENYTQNYIHPISNAAEESMDATAIADAGIANAGDEAYNDPERVVEQASGYAVQNAQNAAVGGEITSADRLNEALSSIGSASNPSSSASVGTSVGTLAGKKAAAKRGSKGGTAGAAASATPTTTTTMGLSGSYISNSGIGIANASEASGSVRASLLSGTPPVDDA